jgi:hypothetical protein
VTAVETTEGQRLYECLLAVRPTQFPEGVHGGDGSYVPRTPWSGLSVRTQWSQEEWERIAAEFWRAPEPRDGKALYRCVLMVNPIQRREFSDYVMRRPAWDRLGERRQEQWHEIARRYAVGAGR